MNELNYASREAAQRLLDAGIVLETEAVWCLLPEHIEWSLLSKYETDFAGAWYETGGKIKTIPAPMFTEVWRELPEWYDRGRKTITQQEGKTSCGYLRLNNSTSTETYISINATDALIDLRIWIEEQKGKETA